MTTNRDNALQVVACPNPFRTENIGLELVTGLSIAEIMAKVQPDPVLRRYAHVYIDSQPIHPDAWQIVPPAGAFVSIRMIPHGGGGGKKNPLATLLSIAVIAAAGFVTGGGAAGLLGSSFAKGTFGAAMLGASVGVAGSLAVAAIAPPPSQNIQSIGNQKDSPALGISGTRNQSGALRVIPRIYGTHKITPYYAAPPYTELVGQDQYLRILFVVGYGPLLIEDMQIGDTPLTDFDDYQIEIRAGWDTDTATSLYPGQVNEEAVGALLTQAGGWVQRTCLPDSDEISVDVGFQGLTKFKTDGSRSALTVELEAEYKLVTDSLWTAFGTQVIQVSPETIELSRGPGHSWQGEEGILKFTRYDVVCIDKNSGRLSIITGQVDRWSQGSSTVPAVPSESYPLYAFEQIGNANPTLHADLRGGEVLASAATNFDLTIGGADGRSLTIAPGDFVSDNLTIRADKTSAVRYGVSLPVTRGDYEVRLRRTTADSTDDKQYDECSWTVLRSITNANPVALPGLTLVAMRIKATDQLNGVINQFNCTATSILPDWDGVAWTANPTSNPAAIYRDIFQGAAMKEPMADSRLDLPELEEWALECAANSFAFNGIFDFGGTPFEAARTVTAVGHATFGLRDGLYSVVRDSPAIQARGIKQHITPHNSKDVQGEKSFDEIHGLQLRFINAAEDYRQDDLIVYADGYSAVNATRIDQLQLFGVTDHDQAWSDGRRYLAEAILRPEMHSRVMDVEHLVSTRGDLIRVVDDVALHGLGSGRIKQITLDVSGNVIAIRVDELLTMEVAKTYGARVRYSDNSEFYFALDTVAGESQYLSPAVPIAAIDAPQVGDLLMFGETDQESVLKIIHHIEILDDLAARIFYVDAAPEIFDATGEIPVYDPQISIPADPQLRLPPADPVLLGITTIDTGQRHADGTSVNAIAITLAPGNTRRGFRRRYERTDTFQVQYKSATEPLPWISLPPVLADNGLAIINDLTVGPDYDIRCRSLTALGDPSDWLETTWSISDLYISGATIISGTAAPFSVTGGSGSCSWAASVGVLNISSGSNVELDVSDVPAGTPGVIRVYDGTTSLALRFTVAGALAALDTVNSSILHASLTSRIDLIDTPTTGLTSRASVLESGQVAADADILAGAESLLESIISADEGFDANRANQFEIARVESKLDAATATYSSEGGTQTEAFEALTTQIETLQATVDTNSSDIATEQTTRASADSAEASERQVLVAEVDSHAPEALLNNVLAITEGREAERANGAAITAEQTARADGDSAEASARQTLAAQVTANGAAITAEQTARADGDSAEAAARQTLAAQVTANGAAITAEQTARADGDSAEAAARQTLAAQVTANGAAITAEQTARADGDSAEASARQTLAATVGENTAAVQETSTALATLDGVVKAAYEVRLDVNGRVIGFGLINDGITSEFGIVADKFWIADPANPGAAQAFPFVVVDGKVVINNAAIETLTGHTIQTAAEPGPGLTIKRFVVDENTNEARFYGDRGDGTIERLASIGINPGETDYTILKLGSGSSNRHCIDATSKEYTTAVLRNEKTAGLAGSGLALSVSNQASGLWAVLSPAARFVAHGSSTAVLAMSTSGVGVNAGGGPSSYDFYAGGESGSTAYGPFTGSHDGLVVKSFTAAPGDILVDVETLFRSGVSNTISRIEVSTGSKQSTVIGVFVWQKDLMIWEAAAMPKAWDKDYSEMYDAIGLNSLGEGQINVCREGGNIEAGDYICSSSTPGKGMKQDDDLLHNYTVAKARESITWADGDNSIKQIACTYHCG